MGLGFLLADHQQRRDLRQRMLADLVVDFLVAQIDLDTQAVVTTITSEGDEYAKVVAAAARRAGLRVEIDLRNEKINYKVREHSLAKIPALLVVGKKEAESHSVSIRRLGSEGQTVLPTDEALAALVDEATPPDLKRAHAA